MIVPDYSAVFQFVLFVVFVLAIRSLVFRPFEALLAAREERIEGAKRKALDLLRIFETAKADYEKRLSQAYAASMARRQAAREAGAAKREELVAAARVELEGTIERAREGLNRELTGVKDELSSHNRELSLDVAHRVVGRDLS